MRPRGKPIRYRFENPFSPSPAPSLSRRRLHAGADGLPGRMATLHEFRVESQIAKRDRHLAPDVKTVGAVHDDGIRLRKLAGPFLYPIRVAPGGALRNIR